jgi:hypothetical protein
LVRRLSRRGGHVENFETMWRMAKVAGGIDATVKYIETVIATPTTFTFRNTVP